MSRIKEKLRSKFHQSSLMEPSSNTARSRSCTPPLRPGVHARAKPLPRRQEMVDSHLVNLETRGIICEDRLADLKLLMAKELSFVNKQIVFVDLMESQAIDWAITLRDLYLPSVLNVTKAWELYLPNRVAVKQSLDKMTYIIEESLDHLVECTTSAALPIRKLLIDIRGQCHVISEGFHLRDVCYQKLTSYRSKSIVLQMMINEGQWPTGAEVTLEDQKALENFMVADRSLRDNLHKFGAQAYARSGDIAARTLHYAQILGNLSGKFKQRLDSAAIRYLDATGEARPTIPCLEVQFQSMPPADSTFWIPSSSRRSFEERSFQTHTPDFPDANSVPLLTTTRAQTLLASDERITSEFAETVPPRFPLEDLR